VSLGTSNGTRHGVCVMDLARPKRRHEQDQGSTNEEE